MSAPDMQWIACGDRMPPPDTPVLAYGPNSGCEVAAWNESGGWEVGKCVLDLGGPVTHWMPLPTRPDGKR